VARRIGWGVADQGVSSLTNFVLLVVAARSLTTDEFGALAIALAVYTVALGLTRSVAGEPLTVRFSAADRVENEPATRQALAAALAMGAAAGAGCALGGLVAGGSVGDALLVLAGLLVGLMLQDTVRFVLMVRSAPRAAVANDSLWLVCELVLLALLADQGVNAVLLAWGAAGCAAGIVGLAQTRVVPRLHGLRAWLAAHRDLWPRFVGEYLTVTGGLQLAFLTLGVVAGLEALGALRAGQVLVGPLNVAFLAVPLVAVPESARLWHSGRGRPVDHARWLAAALATAALAWGIVAATLPDSVGRMLLGASWSAGREVLVPLTIVMVAMGLNLGALCALRVLGASRASLTARVAIAPLVLVATVGGGAAAGAEGAAWGWAAASTAAVFVWYRQLARHAGDRGLLDDAPAVDPAWSAP
jgi:O-antigen/teichoic acid export membrane protein